MMSTLVLSCEDAELGWVTVRAAICCVADTVVSMGSLGLARLLRGSAGRKGQGLVPFVAQLRKSLGLELLRT